MNQDGRELGIEAIVAAAEELDRAGHHALAEVIDREVQAQFKQFVRTVAPNLATDQALGMGSNALGNVGLQPGEQPLGLGDSTLFGDPVGYAKGYVNDPLMWGNDAVKAALHAKFRNSLRTRLISEGYTELVDAKTWRAFQKQMGTEGMENIARQRFGTGFKGWVARQRSTLGVTNLLKGLAEGDARSQAVKSVYDLGHYQDARGVNRPYAKKSLSDFGYSPTPAKSAKLPAAQSAALKAAAGKVAKNEVSALLQHLSSSGQQKVLALMRDIKGGKMNAQQWMPALKQATAKVAGKNEKSIVAALKGVKPGSAGRVVKGLAKRLGPAILVAAFTTIVAEYVDTDPKYAEFAQNPTNNIPGGMAGQIVAYSMPYLGPALMAWDVGWAIGRLIANIPWVKGHLEEVGAGLESMYGEAAGVSVEDQVETKNQLSLEGEIDGGKFAVSMSKKFMDFVRSGVAVDQAWAAVFREMKASEASPEAIMYVRQKYNQVKQTLSDTGAYGNFKMKQVSPAQESAALADIKANIDRLFAAGKQPHEVQEYLNKRLNTVADLRAKSRLRHAAGQYLSARQQGGAPPPAPNPAPAAGLLARGSRGPSVAAWQNFLRSQGVGKLPKNAPPVFGPLTEQATMQFQQAQKIRVDGVVGPETLSKARQLGGKV